VHLLTLAWLARLDRGADEPLHRSFAAGLWLQIAAAVVEWGCIVVQAARGVHSHFNYASFFDHAVFTIMGRGTAVLLTDMVLCAWGISRSWAEALVRQLLLGAFALAVLGALAGVLMVLPTAEQHALLDQGQRLAWIGSTTVCTPSGRVLPFFHWDLDVGDWRAVHFAGLHALQALPLLAWLSQRAAPERRVRMQRLELGGAWAYAVFFMAVAVWTGIGHSVFARAGPAWWLLVAAGLLFVLAALAIVRTGACRQVG
jgi:hypothetical protein